MDHDVEDPADRTRWSLVSNIPDTTRLSLALAAGRESSSQPRRLQLISSRLPLLLFLSPSRHMSRQGRMISNGIVPRTLITIEMVSRTDLKDHPRESLIVIERVFDLVSD